MKVKDFLKDLSVSNPYSKEVINDIASIDWDAEIKQYKINHLCSPVIRSEVIARIDVRGKIIEAISASIFTFFYLMMGPDTITSYMIVNILIGMMVICVNLIYSWVPMLLVFIYFSYGARDYINNYPILRRELTAEEMCDFWVKFIRRTFSNLNRKVDSHKEELQEQLDNLYALRRDFHAEGLEKDPVYREIMLKYENLENSMEENTKIKKAMKELRSVLFQKVDTLTKIVADKKSLEQRSDRVSNIKSRAENILGKSDLTLESWEDEKTQIEEKVRELTLSFQSQFDSAKDLLESTREVEGLLK